MSTKKKSAKKPVAKKAAKPQPKKAPAVKRSPRPQRLPGMEDPQIEALENLAREYDDIKKQRMQLTPLEVEAKKKVMDEMKAQKRDHYHHDGVTIDLVTTKEDVRVKIKTGDDDVEIDVEGDSDAEGNIQEGIGS